MTTYRLIENKPYDEYAEVNYWIEKKSAYFWGLIKFTSYIGKYKFDSGGAWVSMPFFDRQLAEKRLKILNYKLTRK